MKKSFCRSTYIVLDHASLTSTERDLEWCWLGVSHAQARDFAVQNRKQDLGDEWMTIVVNVPELFVRVGVMAQVLFQFEPSSLAKTNFLC